MHSESKSSQAWNDMSIHVLCVTDIYNLAGIFTEACKTDQPPRSHVLVLKVGLQTAMLGTDYAPVKVCLDSQSVWASSML